MRTPSVVKLFLLLSTASVFFASCSFEKPEVVNSPSLTCADYPDDVRAILVNKCATPGCHNSKSYEASSGLDLTNWQTMKKGNDAGAVVIPGNVNYSTLFTFCNTFPDLGFAGQPGKMPVNASLLSYDEMSILRNWILNGAKSRCDDAMFPFEATRGKFVVAHQACDQVAVFDSKLRTIMSLFEAGHTLGASPPESPHMIRYTPDGKYYLVAFFASLVDTSGGGAIAKNYIQRYDANTDMLIDEVEINNGSSGQWGTIAISPDSKKAYTVEYGTGRLSIIDLSLTMTAFTIPSPLFPFPHGVAVSQDNKLYVTSQTPNGQVSVAETTIPEIYSPQIINTGGSEPHEIIFSPDNSKYFISCQTSNEVRVFNTSNNNFITSIPVGVFPQEFSLSLSKPYLFVSCTEDPFNGTKGSVCVIDYNTLTLVQKISTGTQPHGLAVDDKESVVYVANRNVDPSGSAPHHQNSCGGRNGYLTIIDMNTLQLVPGYKYELGVNPYAVAVKP